MTLLLEQAKPQRQPKTHRQRMRATIRHGKSRAMFTEQQPTQKRQFSVQLQLLDDCNLSCLHCYDGLRSSRSPPEEMVLRKRIDQIFAFCASIGAIPGIHLSGGEPTLRRDLSRLVEHITCMRGGHVLLLTNGIRWTADLHESLCQAGLRNIQVSLEGTEQVNDLIRGKGAFRSAMSTVERLVRCGYRVTVSVTVSRLNVSGLQAFVRDLDPLGVHFHLREVLPLGAGAHLPALTRDERREFLTWAVGYSGHATIGLEDPIHCSLHADDASEGCVAGRYHFCVDVDGAVFPCRPLGIPVGTVDALEAAWHSEPMQRLRRRAIEGQCGRCDLRPHCGGCRIQALAQSGNLFGEDDRCFALKDGFVSDSFEQRAMRATTTAGQLIRFECSRLGTPSLSPRKR